MTPPRLAIATCAELPDLDAEGGLLLEAARERGMDPVPVAWDDPEADWEAFDLVVIRSTFDYPRKPEAFLAWVEQLGPRVVNNSTLVSWNHDKRYLRDIESWGFPIVPTRFLSPGDDVSLAEGGEVVVKPAISGGSVDTGRYDAARREEAEAHARRLLDAGRDVLIQPYFASVDEEAETAVVLIEGEPTHAMRKGPLLEVGQELESGLFRLEEMAPREAADDELDLARAVLAAVDERIAPTVYARIDLIRADDGAPHVLEVEVIEPSLFLDHSERATGKLVTALEKRLERR